MQSMSNSVFNSSRQTAYQAVHPSQIERRVNLFLNIITLTGYQAIQNRLFKSALRNGNIQAAEQAIHRGAEIDLGRRDIVQLSNAGKIASLQFYLSQLSKNTRQADTMISARDHGVNGPDQTLVQLLPFTLYPQTHLYSVEQTEYDDYRGDCHIDTILSYERSTLGLREFQNKRTYQRGSFKIKEVFFDADGAFRHPAPYSSGMAIYQGRVTSWLN